LKDEIILVDEKDNIIGSGEKMTVHREGRLHRAFSIFIFNSKNELMLQKRAKGKYHSAGLWTNTCCSHPKKGEKTSEAAMRRLKEEMGFTCDLKEAFNFMYRAKFENGLSENEFDHVFIGTFDGNPEPDKKEVENWKWISLQDLRRDIKKNPENYTYWLRISIDKIISYLESKKAFS
jgi:isopentenyl-diphosphate delta-isomerase